MRKIFFNSSSDIFVYENKEWVSTIYANFFFPRKRDNPRACSKYTVYSKR